MTTENSWLLKTIETKSDQLNAVDLITGAVTVTVIGVKQGSEDQPVIIGIDGGRQPYKPCKSMRRVLISLWGQNPTLWVGRKMTLFCDDSVKWGGEVVGGIRISHMSHIDVPKTLQLNESKAKKKNYRVEPLVIEKPDESTRISKAVAAICKATDLTTLDKAMGLAKKLYNEASEDGKNRIDAAYVETRSTFNV